MEFRRQNLDSEKYMTLVYPVGKNIWIITGSEDNLIIGIRYGLWGVKNDLKYLWKHLKKDDLLLFYCTYPISGIVGYGKILSKVIDKKPFWPNENKEKESKYPLRIKFKPLFRSKNWSRERKSLSRTGISYYHGLNIVEPEKRETIFKMFNLDIDV